MNFCSAIYRIKLKYLLNDESQEATFIVKTGSATSAIQEMLIDMGTFDSETHIYEIILTELKKMFPNFKIAPRYVSDFVSYDKTDKVFFLNKD